MKNVVEIRDYKPFVRKDTGAQVLVLFLAQPCFMRVKSGKNIGKIYQTSKRATMVTNEPLEIVQASKGTTLPGNIVKVACPEYDYKGSDGKTRKLSHTWAFVEAEGTEVF